MAEQEPRWEWSLAQLAECVEREIKRREKNQRLYTVNLTPGQLSDNDQMLAIAKLLRGADRDYNNYFSSLDTPTDAKR